MVTRAIEVSHADGVHFVVTIRTRIWGWFLDCPPPRRHPRIIKAHKIRLHPTPEQAHYFARAAGTLIKVDRFFPSSQLCHTCGGGWTDLTLADREYACPLCGYVGDRDENASWNILQEALRLVGA